MKKFITMLAAIMLSITSNTVFADDEADFYVDMEKNAPVIWEAEDLYAAPNTNFYDYGTRFSIFNNYCSLENVNEQFKNYAIKRLDLVDKNGELIRSDNRSILVHDPKKVFGSEWFYYGGSAINYSLYKYSNYMENYGNNTFAANGEEYIFDLPFIQSCDAMVYNRMDINPKDYYKQLGRGKLIVQFHFDAPLAINDSIFRGLILTQPYSTDLSIIFEDAYTGYCSKIKLPNKYLYEKEFELTFDLPTSQYYVYLERSIANDMMPPDTKVYSYTSKFFSMSEESNDIYTPGSVTLGKSLFFFQPYVASERDLYNDYAANNAYRQVIDVLYENMAEESIANATEIKDLLIADAKRYTMLVTENYLVSVSNDPNKTPTVKFLEKPRDFTFDTGTKFRDYAEETALTDPNCRMIGNVHSTKVSEYQSDYALYTLTKAYGKKLPDGFYQSLATQFVREYPEVAPSDIYSQLEEVYSSFKRSIFCKSKNPEAHQPSTLAEAMDSFVFTNTASPSSNLLVCEGYVKRYIRDFADLNTMDWLMYAFPINVEKQHCLPLVTDMNYYPPQYCDNGNIKSWSASIFQSLHMYEQAVVYTEKPGIHLDSRYPVTLGHYFPSNIYSIVKDMADSEEFPPLYSNSLDKIYGDNMLSPEDVKDPSKVYSYPEINDPVYETGANIPSTEPESVPETEKTTENIPTSASSNIAESAVPTETITTQTATLADNIVVATSSDQTREVGSGSAWICILLITGIVFVGSGAVAYILKKSKK